MRTRVLLLILALCLLGGRYAHAAATDRPLVFGVFPYVAAKEIIETYAPLAASLERQLRRRVLLYTAPDFKTFVARTRAGEYDLLLTAPHLAWVAMAEANYRPLLEHAAPVYGVVVVRADATFDSLDSLRGQTIAIASPIALVVLAAEAELAAAGLVPTADYTTTRATTHVNAAMHVVHGRTHAAILALQPWTTMKPESRAALRIVHQTAPLPGLVYLTHPRLSSAETGALGEALKRFTRTPRGKTFLKRGVHGRLKTVSTDRLAAMQPLARRAQTLLDEAQ